MRKGATCRAASRHFCTEISSGSPWYSGTGDTKAGAEETAAPRRHRLPPGPRRQLTVNFFRHQRVGRGVPEDLSHLRREKGGKPARQAQAQAQAPPGQAATAPTTTSSSFLALPVTNTTLRRAGAAILTPRGACALSRQSPAAAARSRQRPANGEASADA